MKIEILKAEEKATQTGKKLKKCMMEVEGRDFPYKNVTVWEDCPIYEDIKPGHVINEGYHINVQPQKAKDDGSHINPHNNKPYNNYTLYQGEKQNQPTLGSSALEGRVKKVEDDIKQIVEVLKEHKITPKTEEKKDDYQDDEISPEDVPF